MTAIKVTTKSVIVRYQDYRVPCRSGGYTVGPADMSYSLADFQKTAKHYGWGDKANPNDTVLHMGDNCQLFELLVCSLTPTRVNRASC